MASLRSKLSFVSTTHHDQENTTSWTKSLRSRASSMFLRAERIPEARGSEGYKPSLDERDRTELQSPTVPEHPLLLPHELPNQGVIQNSEGFTNPSNGCKVKESPLKQPKSKRSNLSMYAEAFRSSAASLQSGGSPTRILGSLRNRLSRSTLAEAERPGNPISSQDFTERGQPPNPFTEPFPDYMEIPLSPASDLALKSNTDISNSPELPQRRRSNVLFRKTVCDYRTEPQSLIIPSSKQEEPKRIRTDSGYLSVTGLIEISTGSDDQSLDGNGVLEKQSKTITEDPGYICDEESDVASDGFKHTLYAPPIYFNRTPSDEHQMDNSTGTDLPLNGSNFIHPPAKLPTPNLKRTISTSCDSSKLPRYEKLIRSKSPSTSSGHRTMSDAYEADVESEDGSHRRPSMGSRSSHQEKLADRARRYEQIKSELSTEDDVKDDMKFVGVGNVDNLFPLSLDSSRSSVPDPPSTCSSVFGSDVAPLDKEENSSNAGATAGEVGKPRKEAIQLLYLWNAGKDKDEVIDQMLREYDPEFCDILDRVSLAPYCHEPENRTHTCS